MIDKVMKKCYTCSKEIDPDGWHISWCKADGALDFCSSECMKKWQEEPNG